MELNVQGVYPVSAIEPRRFLHHEDSSPSLLLRFPDGCDLVILLTPEQLQSLAHSLLDYALDAADAD